MLLIRYSNSRPVEGALLAIGDQKIRVALKGSDDVTEYRLFSQRWVSDDCEVVTIEVQHESSAEEATEVQFMRGALVCVQFWASAELTTVERP